MALKHDVLSLIAAHPELNSPESWTIVRNYREEQNKIFSTNSPDRDSYYELLKRTANRVYLGNIASRKKVQNLLSELYGQLYRKKLIEELGLKICNTEIGFGKIVGFSDDHRVNILKPNGRKVFYNPLTIKTHREAK